MSVVNINMNGLYGVPKDSSLDFLEYGEFVPLTSVSNFKKGNQFQVEVCNVISPSQFWVHICESSGNTLDKMMFDMNLQYDEDDAGAFPSSMLPIRGLQFCAIKSDDMWYRAVVIGQPTSDGNIKIRRVDYGFEDLVAVTDLRPLRHQWASLPMQALRSQLTKLIPTGPGKDAWSPEQSKAFSDMVGRGPLVATVTAVDMVANSLYLYLQDPVTNQYINCELVKHIASHMHNSLIKPYIPSMPPPGLSRFVLPEISDLPFKDLPLWRQDCRIFVELNKTDKGKALEFFSAKIEDVLHIAYAVI